MNKKTRPARLMLLLPYDLNEGAKAYAKMISPPGVTLTRQDAIRACLKAMVGDLATAETAKAAKR